MMQGVGGLVEAWFTLDRIQERLKKHQNCIRNATESIAGNIFTSI